MLRDAPAQYTDDPAWVSGPALVTRGLALGDVDRDGDLDLVCGNYLGRNTLYLNDGGSFELNPAWQSASAEGTRGVALADVDGDGDLDLVSAEYYRFSVHRNDSGLFTTDPTWSSPATTALLSIMPGDVDGDGDLDLAAGHFGGPDEIYRNDGGAFSRAWVSSVADTTIKVVLGDVDNDADLDLVCGAYGEADISKLYRNDGAWSWSPPIPLPSPSGGSSDVVLGDVDADGDLDLVQFPARRGPNALYLNAGGTFEPTPVWTSAPGDTTNRAALGDIDCDGDVDLACLGSYGHWTCVYLNVGVNFAAAPACSLGRFDWSRSIALGDVDGDGDLDLVCGNDDPNKLYLASGYTLEEAPDWQSARSDPTSGIALGDMDGDGDLDLACGNSSARGNTLYRNDGGTWMSDPIWIAATADWTEDVVLVDVDADGDLDLVCGNALSESEAMYRNDGGTLTANPVWTSSLGTETSSIAAGDVDGDGDPDLVCGNVGEKNTLYRNDGGLFTADSVWASAPANVTMDVALGDVDGDGDLDLVCGNMAQANTLYRNDGGRLGSSPVWSSGLTHQTTSVALGDVDGDDDLDLACGNRGAANTLYRNDGGTLTSGPVWLSIPTNYTLGVAFADVDGDGDLDLACANDNERNTVYLNHGGVLADTPVWLSTPANSSSDVAAGDVDGDGDLDLVFGNQGQSMTLYRGMTRPVYKGDPATPISYLPNNAAHLRDIRRVTPATNLVRVSFSAVDVESDPLWVVPEYAFEGSRTWRPVQIGGGATITERLASSPAGTSHTIDWDVSTFPADTRNAVLRLRAISNPSRTGLIRHVASHDVQLGQLIPRRPEIQVSEASLSFPTVTVGDTVTVSLGISNGGNAELTIHAVTLPSPEMTTAEHFPLPIAPGAARTLPIDLAPRNELTVSGNLIVESNDPFTPALALPVEADIQDLQVETNVFAAGDVVPLGEALTIQVIPAEQVHVERGALHHRPALEGGAFTPLELFVLGDAFVCVLPGSLVTESDLEFYVEVENSGVLRTDPPGAPVDSLFFQDVASPNGITTAPQAGSGGRVLVGQSIDILVELGEGGQWMHGVLHHRRGGESIYRTVPIEDVGSGPRGTVPAEHVDARGLEYWVEVATRTNPRITDPPSLPDLAPRTVRTTVLDLEEDGTTPGGRYRMLSVPLDFDPFQGTLEALLADESEFGSYDPTKWRAFRYVAAEDRNAEISEGGTIFRPVPGRGFWLISRVDHRVDTAPLDGLSTGTDGEFPIILEPGWNQVGNPFSFPVAWSSVKRSLAIEDPVAFDLELEDYAEEPPDILVPYQAYFVRNVASAPETIRVPPVEAIPGAAPAGRRGGVEPEWRLGLWAKSPQATGTMIVVGTHAEAVDSRDDQDRSSPPPLPGRWVRLAAANWGWSERPGLYRRDYRSAGAEGHQWDLEVLASEAGADVAIWSNEPEGSHSLAALLIDVEQKMALALGPGKAHRVVAFGPDRPYRLALLAGTEEYISREGSRWVEIPPALVLDPSAPNPFRLATRLRFGLPCASDVDLVVYDLRGRQVTRLVDGGLAAGYHTAVWDGRDAAGRRVASGVYFYRLVTNSGARTGRIVMIR